LRVGLHVSAVPTVINGTHLRFEIYEWVVTKNWWHRSSISPVERI